MNYLLDTNVVSEWRKPRPDSNVVEWLNSVSSSSLFVSALVIGELRYGVELLYRRDYRQAVALDGWLQDFISDFSDRIIPVTVDIAEEWGRMNVSDRLPANVPDLLPAIDGLLAATSKIHRVTFVTRDTGRLANYDVRLINPFDPNLQSDT